MIKEILIEEKKHLAIVLNAEITMETLSEMRNSLITTLGIADNTPSDNYFVHLLLSEIMPSSNQVTI